MFLIFFLLSPGDDLVLDSRGCFLLKLMARIKWT